MHQTKLYILELELLKDQYCNLLEKWEISEENYRDSLKDIKRIKLDHRLLLNNITEEFEKKIKKLNSKIKKIDERNNLSNKNFKNELKLNDEILNRHKKHIEVLKKKYVFCQNVIK
mmetsp:Transcript_16643/g.14546  ORF Transcript_16643/g.14546 Transcript_16643/m.14546 type:complete len:116 (-) Transcript_16643:480-827(-)